MKSLKQIIEKRLAEIREAIETLDNLGASVEARADAIRQIVGGDPEFWLGLEKTLRPKPATMKAEEISPFEVVKMEEATRKPVAVLPQVPLPNPAPKKPVASEVSSARELDDPVRELKGELKRFLGERGDVPRIKHLVKKVFSEGYLLGHDFWEIFFQALSKADACRIFFLDRNVLDEIWQSAPKDFLSDYVFGQDGLLIKNLAFLSEKNQMQPHDVGRVYTLLGILRVIDGPEENLLSDHEVHQVKRVLRAVSDLKGPDDLVEQLRVFVGPDTPPAPKEEVIPPDPPSKDESELAFSEDEKRLKEEIEAKRIERKIRKRAKKELAVAKKGNAKFYLGEKLANLHVN